MYATCCIVLIYFLFLPCISLMLYKTENEKENRNTFILEMFYSLSQ